MKYYHGTSNTQISDMILPPAITDCLQEVGRKKNLDMVFFTISPKSAAIYAGRAYNRYGGEKRVLEVEPIGEVFCLCDTPGTEVYYAQSAKVISVLI